MTKAICEKVKFWRDPALSDLELLWATYITHSFSPHAHEGFAIGVIIDGAEAFAYRGARYAAPAGSVVVIQPGEVHTGHAATEAGWSYRMLYPDAALLQKAASEVAGRESLLPFFPTPVIQDKQLARCLSRLHLVLETATERLERESCFLWTLAQLVTRYAEIRVELRSVGRENESVKRVQEYLGTHFAENVSLEQVAALAELSPFHFIRVFHRQVGLPPHAYLTQVRIRKAKILLALGEPIAQVAVKTGFADQSHLTKHFKRIVGVTPGKYVVGSNNSSPFERKDKISGSLLLGDKGNYTVV